MIVSTILSNENVEDSLDPIFDIDPSDNKIYRINQLEFSFQFTFQRYGIKQLEFSFQYIYNYSDLGDFFEDYRYGKSRSAKHCSREGI